MKWTLSEIAKVVGGELLNQPSEDVIVTHVATNSQDAVKGTIFVPLVAERNGHEFVADAVKRGAVASFWSDPVDEAPTGLPLIRVEDTEKALSAFAKGHLEKVSPKVVGITGSNGKTTTKDMTDAVLSQKFKTHKTPGNENNQLGVPRTILSMPEETEVLILEMGMSAPGEISILSKLGEPDVAVVTMIGESHIQAFGSRENLALEKMAILAGLREDGLFIHPENEELITKNLDLNIRTQTFGMDEQATLFSTEVHGDARKTSFTVEGINIVLPIPGEYNVNNALIALLIGQEFGLSIAEGKKGLEQMELTKNRLEWIEGKRGINLLNDAYNASPTSMKAALNYFAAIEIEGEKIVVLGDILELGEASKAYHEGIAKAIHLDRFKAVYLYGEEMKALFEKLSDKEKVRHFTGSKEALIETIEENTNAGDAVFFKSSNGTDLLSVVERLS